MKERLGNYIQEYSVRNKNGEDIPVYSVTNTQGFCRDYFGKEVASKDRTTYKIVPRGCFAYNPSRITRFALDIATLFHKFYTVCKVKGREDTLLNARLSLCSAVKITLKNALTILNISAPEEM